jgi:hypothetical protein
MSGSLLQDVLGPNSSQDATSITISKQDLSDNSGLTVVDEVDGEGAIAAIVITAAALGLNVTNRDGDGEEIDPSTSQQIAISGPTTTVVPRVDSEDSVTFYKRDTLTIDLDFPLAGINPDNY